MTVAKYPVENSDEEGVVDAVNYLLSGPAGLGQNFSGYSTYIPAYLRPTFRQPFVTPITDAGIPLYAYYPISNATGCDVNGTPVLTPTRFAKFTLNPPTPFVTPPYTYGDRVNVKNVNPSFYDDVRYLVFSCTTTDVIIQTNNEYVWPAYVSGGELGTDRLNQQLSTDCNGRVTVNGGSDRVFVSGQLLCNVDYNSTVPNSEFDIIVSIDRLTGYLSTAPGDNDYTFGDPTTTVAKRTFHYTVTGNGSITDLETIFTQFIDGPDIPFGYYWYLLQFEFRTTDDAGVPYPGDATAGVVTLGLRSLTAQVVKQ